MRLERPFELDTSNHTADERLTLQQWRWWPLAELVDPDAEIWPAYLLRLVDLIDRPDQRPVAFGMTEESSVPVLPGGQFPSGGGNGQVRAPRRPPVVEASSVRITVVAPGGRSKDTVNCAGVPGGTASILPRSLFSPAPMVGTCSVLFAS